MLTHLFSTNILPRGLLFRHNPVHNFQLCYRSPPPASFRGSWMESPPPLLITSSLRRGLELPPPHPHTPPLNRMGHCCPQYVLKDIKDTNTLSCC